MIDKRQFFAGASLFLAAVLAITACRNQSPRIDGAWSGFIKNPSGEEVAFNLEVKRDGDRIIGTLVNGDDRIDSASGSFDGDTLKLKYDYYDGELTAKLAGDVLQGVFARQWRNQTLKKELRATRPAKNNSAANNAINLSGEWVLRVGDAPKQSLWRATFHDKDGEVRGTIIPLSGDWGEMWGRFENGILTLNRFDVINARVLKVSVMKDGNLGGTVDLGLFDPQRRVIAERLDPNNKELIASLPNPVDHTRMIDPSEPLRFSFPDLDGKIVSSNDPRFKGKVVVVSITGSWCPNCHEETPLMEEFYERYRDKGFEVVALAFEYTGNAERDLEQVRIFSKRHKVSFPVLLAGSTDDGEIAKKLPQIVDFSGYPTTIFIGRDGLVKRIHTGFEGRATGERFVKLKAEYEDLIKELLSEGD